jgi:hypothetical protein
MKILLDPLPAAGGGTPPPAKPVSTPAASAPPSAAPPASAPPPAAPVATPDDDPFAPPAKSAAAAPAKPAATPDDFEKLAPKELRERYKTTKAERDAAKAERDALTKAKTDLEARIKSFESQDKDTTALTKRLTAVEKERDEVLGRERAARFQESPEFKEKYDKPFNQAAERARKQVTELAVTNAEDGTTRPATWADFTALYSLPVGKAIEQANALFGVSANFVLGLREKLLDMDTAKKSALQEEQEQFKQRDEADAANRVQASEFIKSDWAATMQRVGELPDYKNDPEDTELTEARKHALAQFGVQVKGTGQELIKNTHARNAHIQHRTAAFSVQKIMLARKDAEIAKLQSQVEELKGSAPGGVKRPGGVAPAGGEDDMEGWNKGLKAAVQPE